MDNQTLETPNFNTILFLMAGLSPRVKDSLEKESYRESADQDEATNQYILEDAFQSLTKDLLEIGLVIDADSSAIVENETKIYEFISLATYLLPNSLYPLIKSNEQIRNCIHHLVTGSLGDSGTLIQSYLSELGGLDGQDPLVLDLHEVLDYYYPVISQTEIFTDYLKNLYYLTVQERIAIEADPEEHTVYRNKVKEIIGRMSDVINGMTHHLLYDNLCSVQNIFIKDLIAPDNFIDYNYLFTTDPDTLPEEIKILLGQKNYHYRVSHPWCLDYYQVRKLTPSPTQVMMMYAFMYAVIEKKEEYQQAIGDLSKNYPSPDINNIITNLYKG